MTYAALIVSNLLFIWLSFNLWNRLRRYETYVMDIEDEYANGGNRNVDD